MPTPNKGESEKAFVERCIDVVIHEADVKSGAHAAAKCHGIYRQHRKKGHRAAVEAGVKEGSK